jgi:phage terminase large subunit-like protein
MGLGMKTDGWPGAEFWAGAVDETLTLDSLIERSEAIVIGVDGGGLDDLFGLSILGREKETKRWLSWSHAWCHRGVLNRRLSIASRLEDFAAAGELTIVDDKLDDVSAIVGIVERVKDGGQLSCVALDIEGPYGEFVDALATIGVDEASEQIVGIGQGYRLMGAIKTVERKLANGTFVHAKSALMDWCVGNVKLEATATAIRATKSNAGDAKIDAWCALMDAATVMVKNPDRKPEYHIHFA